MNLTLETFKKWVGEIEKTNEELPKTKLTLPLTTGEAREIITQIHSLITTIESLQKEIDFAVTTLNDIYDHRPAADENYLHALNECQHKAKHVANEIEWRRRNAK